MQKPPFKIPDAARPPPFLFSLMRMAPKLAYWGLPLAIGGRKLITLSSILSAAIVTPIYFEIRGLVYLSRTYAEL